MTNTTRIGFIGLGNMGTPIAKNLIAAGFDVTIYNRTPAKTSAFQSLRASIAATPQGAAAHADVVITMLSDDDALNDISKQIVPALEKNAIHVSMSTVAPATVNALLSLHNEYNVQYVAAPVMGRPPAAEAKLLSVLLSGDAQAKETIKPIVEAISQNHFDCGDDPTSAHAVKLALNLMVFTSVELLAEVMLFAEKKSINKNTLRDIINNTALGSPLLKNYSQLIIDEKNQSGGFATRLANKDVRLLQETAATVGIKLPLADLVRTNFEESIAAGKGEQDVSLIVQELRTKLSF